MKKINILSLLITFSSLWAQDYDKSYVSALNVRNVGPAFTSGRISDLVVDHQQAGVYYIAAASGGVWKTNNWGTTFTPIFDQQGSYSIGCITIDPNQNNTIWVGTGENNNQRSVAYGDGVYKSEDGGKTWSNMGLKKSEHISKIIVHPDSSNVVYVAAYGPLWSKGGERSIYKSTDGGQTWKAILSVSEDTGFSDLIMDPSNPKIMYAAAHMRRRHVWTYIGGGEESGVLKTTDGGKTWNRIENGLPTHEMGRIGLAISAHHQYIYAIVEAKYGKGGIYRSDNQGANWTKMSSYATSGNYYQEIIPDPIDDNKLFIMDTWLHHTEDGGKTVVATGEEFKHVDNHAMWINPSNTSHWLVGCDGGLYETYDHGKTWDYKDNLPIIQFYKVAIDQDYPFFNIYGGTQDNSSQGGPSQTRNNVGIINADWFITNGGDGFESAIDPIDPNIVYAQSQYGWLVRYNKKTGEKVGIQPMPGKDEAAYRFNWDAPLLISPHDHKRIYFAANKVFRSDNYGNDWKTISPDLSKGIDRNQLKVMDKIWSVDAVMKNKSTTIYGNIVALDESPFMENLLIAGTDDGNIYLSKDAENWNKINLPKELPTEQIYVNNLIFSKHNKNRVYAVFNHHKSGDFSPYLYKSDDLGKTWNNISGDLPKRGSTYDIIEDHKASNILFTGTEFGAYVSIDAGIHWTKINQLPTIAIRDLEIHERTNSLVMASFGRGFYVMDDYSYLRKIKNQMEKLVVHAPDTVLMFVPSNPLGYRGKAAQGHNYYAAENPEVGLTLRSYINFPFESQLDLRKKKEKENLKDHKDNPYPSWEALRSEEEEKTPYIIYSVMDLNGKEIYRNKDSYQKGWNKWHWNLRYSSTNPIQLSTGKLGRYSSADVGPLVLAGTYTIKVSIYNGKDELQQAQSTPFVIKDLDHMDRNENYLESKLSFQNQVAEVRRMYAGISSILGESENITKFLEHTTTNYPEIPLDTAQIKIKELQSLIKELRLGLYGDKFQSKYEVETPPSVYDRIEIIVYQSWYNQMEITGTQKANFDIAYAALANLHQQSLKISNKIKELEAWLSIYKIPYTPNRDINWKKDKY